MGEARAAAALESVYQLYKSHTRSLLDLRLRLYMACFSGMESRVVTLDPNENLEYGRVVGEMAALSGQDVSLEISQLLLLKLKVDGKICLTETKASNS